MTVQTTDTKTDYEANGSTINFDFDFPAESENDIYVTLVANDGTETDYMNYSVVLTGAGGTVTTGDVLDDVKIVIYRDTQQTQNTDYIEGGSFPAQAHENALDKLTLIAQEQQEELDRTLRSSIGASIPYQLGELEDDKLLYLNGDIISSSAYDETRFGETYTDSITISEIATSLEGGQAGGAPIDETTNRLGEVLTTANGYQKQINAVFAGASGNHRGDYAIGVVYDYYNDYYTYDNGGTIQQWAVKDTVALPYTATEADPNTDTNLTLRGDASQGWVKNSFSNTNLLTNSGFEVPSPDGTDPNGTHAAGVQIFLNWFAGAAGATTTYAGGALTVTAGEVYQDKPLSGDLSIETNFSTSYSSGVAGVPEQGASVSVDVTAGVNARVTLLAGSYFSIKLEQGQEATRHSVLQSNKKQFANAADLISGASGAASLGDKVSTGATSWRIGVTGALALDSGLFATPLNGCHLIDFNLNADGTTDDTAAIDLWWSVGGTLIGFEASVSYNGTGLRNQDLQGSSVIHGNGIEFVCNPSTNQYYFIQVTVADNASTRKIHYNNFTILANGLFAYGIRVDRASENSPFVENVTVDKVTVRDLDNANLATVSSCGGIRVACNSSNTLITNNFVINVNRTQVNPSVVSSSGISVDKASSNVGIVNNNIRSILSPSGDADADGIVVFSSNRLILPAERQQLLPIISGNRITQCKGRFIKLQTANAKINNNYMESIDIELIDNFTGIDAQTGGCDIYDNQMRMGWSVGGASAAFASLQSKEAGGLESTYSVHDNLFILENDIPYGFIVVVEDNTDSTISIKSNIIQSDGYGFNGFARFTLPLTAERLIIDVSDNQIPIGVGALLQASGQTAIDWSDDTTGPVMGGYIQLTAINNVNTQSESTSDIFNAANVIPYLPNMLFNGNKGFTRSSLTLKGVDADTIPEGNCFEYNTDGGSGGILNAPSSLNRNTTIEAIGSNIVRLTYLTGGRTAQSRKGTGTWYNFTLTL